MSKLQVKKAAARLRRQRSVRAKIKGTALRPRLCVFRSNKHIYAQLIDDQARVTLASTSTEAPDLKDELSGKKKTDAAHLIGKKIAEKCKDLSIETIVFDRNGFVYHGRVRAVAEGAREGGLQF